MADSRKHVYIKSCFSNAKLNYTLHYIFVERLGITFSINSDTIPDGSIIIGYGSQNNTTFNIPDCDYLHPSGIPGFFPEVRKNTVTPGGSHNYNNILTEQDSKLYRNVTTHKDSRFQQSYSIELFPTTENGFCIKFDLFSSVFFMLSRHEEYISTDTDQHGRFDLQHSFAFRHKFHNRAVVDEWIGLLRSQLQPFFTADLFRKEIPAFSLTIDVDQIFSYRCKGFIRNTGGWLRDLFKGKIGTYLERPLVLLGLLNDPFDTFAIAESWAKKHQIALQYFILAATDRCDFDKNGRLNCPKALQVLKNIEHPGLHPSYDCLNDDEKLANEHKLLESLCGKKIDTARRHFLRMRLPESYRQLTEQGFTHDYTMGFASGIGFRAGTSRPFLFFDMQTDEVLPLTVHPFCVMDGSLKDYKQLKLSEASDELQQMAAYIQSTNGIFEILIHNETLSEKGRWKGWTTMLEQLIKSFQNLQS
ncbi:MAG: hypothetical protein CVU11_11065 [Bacteroidetes bacterium HGW-Bacteroidetes-6]|jgi:hypothetical protein|nr:MAG: hypothetical protein CVU11_11065 [Bacteroidetes bacterium HGW-Bacteroidetes-6]